jgi:putative glutamine amidotransferase
VVSNDSDTAIVRGNRDAHPERSRPLIGITTYLERARYGVWDTVGPVLPRTYVDAVLRAGGVPLLLPPVGDVQADVVDAVDGLVLSGGADIDPTRYAEVAHPRTVGTRPGRDGYEFALLDAALAAGVPIFGVCRGLELLNVAFGGTLTQHLPEVVGHAEHQPAPAVFGDMTVHVDAGSSLAGILGSEAKVRCYLHQAIGRLADGLRATAWSDDGTIEAVELKDGGQFVLGVQWHPEETGAGGGTDDRLFAALVDAAEVYRARRPWRH